MRYIKILVFTLLVLTCNSIFAQMIKFGNNAYSHIPTSNQYLLVNWSNPTTFKINPTFTRNGASPWINLPIKGEFTLDYFDQNEGAYKVFFTATFTQADWATGIFVSNVLTKDVTLPAFVVRPLSPIKEINLRYRYYREGYPHPENNNGWTDWYFAESKSIMVSPNSLPVTTFSVSDNICSEETFTVTNPYNISLVNGAGIATLTDLGLNKWKITRIGNSNGKVTLRSTNGTKNFDKEIVIGSPPPLIDGVSEITTVGEYLYTVYKSSPGTTIEYNKMLGDVEFIPVNDNSFKLRVSTPNTSGFTMSVRIRAREINSCGTSNYTILNVGIKGNM